LSEKRKKKPPQENGLFANERWAVLRFATECHSTFLGIKTLVGKKKKTVERIKGLLPL